MQEEELYYTLDDELSAELLGLRRESEEYEDKDIDGWRA
jgi:hypothetical protein